jgi:hypothetical protein
VAGPRNVSARRKLSQAVLIPGTFLRKKRLFEESSKNESDRRAERPQLPLERPDSISCR